MPVALQDYVAWSSANRALLSQGLTQVLAAQHAVLADALQWSTDSNSPDFNSSNTDTAEAALRRQHADLAAISAASVPLQTDTEALAALPPCPDGQVASMLGQVTSMMEQAASGFATGSPAGIQTAISEVTEVEGPIATSLANRLNQLNAQVQQWNAANGAN